VMKHTDALTIQNAVHHRYSKLLSENASLRQVRFSFPDLSESVPNFIVLILGFIPGLTLNFPEFGVSDGQEIEPFREKNWLGSPPRGDNVGF